MMKGILILIAFFCAWQSVAAQVILVPMDEKQKEHLKAYGAAYYVIARGVSVDWLLNYRGGSFAFLHTREFEDTLRVRGISYEMISAASYDQILSGILSPSTNQDAVKLEKAPKIAVYSPKSAQPWDDAVTLVLTYAQIPYEVVYDDEVLRGDLTNKKFDWLHLHHEDFTGQYGRFWASYHTADWYKQQVAEQEAIARKWGYKKVSQLKLAVAKTIKEYVNQGGFLFAMCSATDSYDIALAAEGTDICEYMYDGDPRDPHAQSKLDFSKCFAFENFVLEPNPIRYEYSNIDVSDTRKVVEAMDYFTLFEFSAKYDPVPSMLCQNHTKIIKGFMGQSTAFDKKLIKKDVLIMGEYKSQNEARYIHGNFGSGMWTFYGGHDPEDYRHHVGEEPTQMELHPNSPGYRLILNNILFPAAKKKKQKT
jgi:hypothetical protein